MSDIFISYSRKDSEHALSLAERLRASGMEVWIDQRGIEAATSWSGEIADAIRATKAFVLLLSASSTESPNVKKELGVATEVGCSLVPIEIEKIELNRDFLYHLAGLQRVAITDFDGIMRALTKMGISPGGGRIVGDAATLHAKHQVPNPRVGGGVSATTPPDLRKSLMILPFEDLSPTADNQWFADGIVNELISMLSNIKSLRIADNQATKEFRKYHGQLTTYAREMNFRYFVQGDVRKFGDQIKISVWLLDIETGNHLWQDSMKGTMNDIFDIQEKVATNVVGGLNIILTREEKSKLDERGTENAEAYEYFMRAGELNELNTREGFLLSISLYDLAIKLDPNFVGAIADKAFVTILLFKSYERDPNLLRQAELLLQRLAELNPAAWRTHDLLSGIFLLEGRKVDAEREHQEHIGKDDGSAISQAQLGYFCFCMKQYAKAFEYYESSLKIDPNIQWHLWNVIINARNSGNNEGLDRWAKLAIPAFLKRLRLHPEDESARYRLASTYLWINPPRRDESMKEIDNLEAMPDLDPGVQYQVALLLVQHGEYIHAIEALRKAIRKGYADAGKARGATSSFAPLHGNPEFEAVMKEAEAKQNV